MLFQVVYRKQSKAAMRTEYLPRSESKDQLPRQSVTLIRIIHKISIYSSE